MPGVVHTDHASAARPGFRRDRLVLSVVSLVLTTFLSGGIVQGWGPLHSTLIREHQYSERCPAGEVECPAQENALEQIFVSAFIALSAGSVVIGILIDSWGPRKAAALGLGAAMLGFLLFGLSESSTFDAFVPGFCLIAGGGVGPYLAHMHVGALWGSRHGMWVSVVAAAFNLAGFVLFVPNQAQWSRQTFFLVWAALCALALVAVWQLYPDKPYTASSPGVWFPYRGYLYGAKPPQRGGDAEGLLGDDGVAEASGEGDRLQGDGDAAGEGATVAGALGGGTGQVEAFGIKAGGTSSPVPVPDAGRRASDGDWVRAAAGPGAGLHTHAHEHPPREPSASDLYASGGDAAAAAVASADTATEPIGSLFAKVVPYLKTSKLWLVVAWYSLVLLVVSFIGGAIPDILSRQLKDTSGLYSDILYPFLGNAAFLFNPLVGLLIERVGFASAFAGTNLATIAVLLLVLIPSLPLQALSFLVYAMQKSGMFTALFAYLAIEYPANLYGSLVAVVTGIAAIVGLMALVLVPLVQETFNGSYVAVNCGLALATVPLFALPWSVRRAALLHSQRRSSVQREASTGAF